jgi:hypothetical protein
MKLALKLMLALAIITATASIIAAGKRTPYNRNQPGEVSISPTSPSGDQDVQFTLTMDGTTTEDVFVTIGCTDSSAFTTLPSYVIVPYGQSQVTFSGHTSTTFSSWAIVAATANGGTALGLTQAE